MARLNFWDINRQKDYTFIDRQAREVLEIGGMAVYIHKYIGPANATGDTPETTIDDLVFLENRSRRYEETIYDLKGHYLPQNADFDLTQFGLFLSNDVIFVEFHINQMVERLGRKLLAGDVLELPHLREFFTLNEDDPAFNKYFVVEEGSRSATGYGPTWWPHIWRVKAKTIPGSEEFSDIIGTDAQTVVTDADGNEIGRAESETSEAYGKITSSDFDKSVVDGILEEAECNVKYDPTYYQGYHYYIYKDDDGHPLVYWGTGDGAPPNGEQLLGEGDEFPDSMQDGEYFLRTDFNPPTLYMKDGCKFIRIEADLRQCWTAQNRLLDTFIDNNETITHDDCTTEPSRQALSKVVRPKDKK